MNELIRGHSGYAYCRRTVLSLPWHSSLTAGAKFCRCRGKVLPLRWQCSASRVAQFSHRSQRTLRRQSENCATAARELCY
ncbi:MAG: hypothetical protein IJ901_06515 [Bacteroidaceae bacterium]|nr:hypothetical protein [Bacteroidaceae bacterium]